MLSSSQHLGGDDPASEYDLKTRTTMLTTRELEKSTPRYTPTISAADLREAIIGSSDAIIDVPHRRIGKTASGTTTRNYDGTPRPCWRQEHNEGMLYNNLAQLSAAPTIRKTKYQTVVPSVDSSANATSGSVDPRPEPQQQLETKEEPAQNKSDQDSSED
jgi:hypothetical protein